MQFLLLCYLYIGLSASSLSAQQRTSFLLVNGGIEEEANHDSFRHDLQAFHRFLADGKPVSALDAGGPGTGYIKSIISEEEYILLPREDLGYLVLGSDPIGLPTKAATKENLYAAYQDLKSTKNSVTAVFSDHGNPEGIGLWNGIEFSPKEHFQLQQSLPPDVLYRSVHLHCHSGAMILDPKRKLPNESEDWNRYLGQNYRKNSCSLGVGQADEMTFSVASPKLVIEESRWNTLLATKPKPSLRVLAERIRELPNIQSTPTLTSELLVGDIFDFLCKKENPQKENHGQPESTIGTHGSSPQISTHSIGKSTCESDLIKKEKELQAQLLASQKIYIDVMHLKKELAIQVLERKKKAETEAWKKSIEEQEKLLAEVATQDLSKEKLAEIEKKLAKLVQDHKAIRIESFAIGEGLKNSEELELEYRTWRESPDSKKKYPDLVEFIPRWDVKDILSLSDAAGAGYSSRQVERNEAFRKLQKLKMEFVERQLTLRKADPDFKIIQEYYESIKKCEDTPLA